MRSFKITENIEIVCRSERTRNGFRHLASLLIDSIEIDKAKCCYLNRTWEAYEFQSVMLELVNKTKALNETEKRICVAYLQGNHTDWSQFKATGMVALLGDLLCKDKKESNDWKARMLKAGLGNIGLEMPKDWDSLDEDTKKQRLDLVIAQISKKGVD